MSNATAVLRAFATSPEWSVSDLARETGLHRSAVHRLLHTLTHGGLLERVEPGVYGLGSELIRLGRQAERRNRLAPLAREHMEKLAATTGDSVTLVALRGASAVYVDIVDGSHPLRFSVEVDDAVQLHAGAGGRALLAFQPDAVIEQALARRLERYTEHTPVDPAALRARLAETRASGYAFSVGEVTPGSRTVAAPVRDHTGAVVAAVAITTPDVRMPDEEVPRFARLVTSATTELSERLGYRPGGPPTTKGTRWKRT
ncbi:IclR family transcriptional regulator [Conexibacter sp. JD483]|uniref:IclR family transcriptional regulator n=1 Tax=unclassified Conexibacter TaxID=2627773 RepID=UPI002717C80B|nr:MULTISPECIES: IclR family transcriptional regulator [unclassified Conexibacter]MDO8187677.1 IclR family transcriptional regulator [Conexibacter sp. CPCC 205706]MDO8199862.1 IclR family transcriptional regulator [Conexibacter sp. CPCC 205762]MDR9370239.1 IclR family transcriptional regulator [Conexibacter sp. JD483]